MPAMVWIFIVVKNRYLNLSAVLKFPNTENEPKRAETEECNLQPATTIHVHKEADFENPFIKGRGFINLGISKMSFTF